MDNRERDFRNELQALLDKYQAELEITDSGLDYGMHRGIAIVSMSGVDDEKTNEQIYPPMDFRL